MSHRLSTPQKLKYETKVIKVLVERLIESLVLEYDHVVVRHFHSLPQVTPFLPLTELNTWKHEGGAVLT